MFTVTAQEYVPGGEVVFEFSGESFSSVGNLFLAKFEEYCLKDPSCTEYHLPDLTGADPDVLMEVQWVCTEGDMSSDYIMTLTVEV